VSLTVRELIGLPHLRIEVVAGEVGLDRVVTWAHASDLDEPWGWLSGGELLLKNGRSMPRGDLSQCAFLEGLGRAQISALIIGSDPESPPLAPTALTRAEQLGIPVLRVPYSMSFIVLSRTVADAVSDERTARIARTERIYDSISAAVSDQDPRAFLARLSSEFGCSLFVVDAETLEPVLEGTSALSPTTSTALVEEIQRRGTALPGTVRVKSPRGHNVLAVEIPYEVPTYLVAEFTRAQAPDVLLLQHAATAVAVEVAHESFRADHHRQLGTELFAQLADGSIDSVAGAAQLRLYGLAPGDARLLAISGVDPLQERQLQIGLRRRKISHLFWRREGTLFILLTVTSSTSPLLGRLTTTGTVGQSAPLRDASRTPSAMREAIWALAGTNRDRPFISFEDAAPLAGLHSPEEAQALVTSVLGPILDYDKAHGTDLLESLEVFLNSQRSWQRCAEALHVHRQTVIYRMRRVEQLTSRTLADTADLAILWLALAAFDVLNLKEK
jgi:purine catabolism regulator